MNELRDNKCMTDYVFTRDIVECILEAHQATTAIGVVSTATGKAAWIKTLRSVCKRWTGLVKSSGDADAQHRQAYIAQLLDDAKDGEAVEVSMRLEMLRDEAIDSVFTELDDAETARDEARMALGEISNTLDNTDY